MIAMYPPTAYPPGEPCPRCAEYERRLDELQKMYDRIAAELIEALDRASAYRIAAAQSYDGPERRLAIERRKLEASFLVTGLRKNVKDRRKSWPR